MALMVLMPTQQEIHLQAESAPDIPQFVPHPLPLPAVTAKRVTARIERVPQCREVADSNDPTHLPQCVPHALKVAAICATHLR